MSMDKNLENKKRSLLERLIKLGYLRDKRLYKAFMELDLEAFIPREYIKVARLYDDTPNLFYFKSEENFRTISAPHMISIMIQGLALEPDDDLLILGAKSGYIASLAHKLAPKGEIIIVEANSDIAKITMDNIEKLGYQDSISVIVKNPLEGMPDLSPWQKILVTGAIKQERIHPLLRQLDSDEGVLYAPIGEDFVQVYTQILRVKQEFFGKKQLQVRFTPLMTQVELDELQLITDFDEEIEIQDDPSKVEDALKKISIKYTTNILDQVKLKPEPKTKKVDKELKENVDIIFASLLKSIKKMKNEEKPEEILQLVINLEDKISELKEYKSMFDLKLKKIQNFLNQIRTYSIVRKDIEETESPDVELIDKKLEIINLNLKEINDLQDFLEEEIKRIKAL